MSPWATGGGGGEGGRDSILIYMRVQLLASGSTNLLLCIDIYLTNDTQECIAFVD